MIKNKTAAAIKNLKNVREYTGNSAMENLPAIKAPEKNTVAITIKFLSINSLILFLFKLITSFFILLPPEFVVIRYILAIIIFFYNSL